MAMSYFDDIYEFHAKLDLPVGQGPYTPLTESRREFRIKLMCEEWDELVEAMVVGDPLEIAKEAADLIVTVLGTIVETGLDFDEAWRLVHESNLAKAGGPRRADGKALKPEGWKPPDLSGLLGERDA